MIRNFEHISNYDDIPEDIIINDDDDANEIDFLNEIFDVKF